MGNSERNFIAAVYLYGKEETVEMRINFFLWDARRSSRLATISYILFCENNALFETEWETF